MSNSQITPAPVYCTDDDYSHCANCIDIVECPLSPNTDGELYVTPDDIEYLDIIGEVIEASEGPDYVI